MYKPSEEMALPLTKAFITNPQIPYCSRRVQHTLRALLKRHPYLRHHQDGLSVLEKKIPVITLGTGRRKALFVGAIHGREYLTTGYLLRLLEEFSLSLENNTLYGGFSLSQLLHAFTLYFVPIANPDGVDISLCLCKKPFGVNIPPALFKNNARNINLNANFPFLFNKVPEYRQGGAKAASEAETKFLINLCEAENFELMISFHTRGGVVFYRDSHNKRIPCDKEIAQKLQSLCRLEVMDISSEEKDFSGGFENWFRHRFRKAAFCVELVRDESADFLQSVRDFYSSCDFQFSRLIIPAAISVIK